eukprot:TRINITY_DN13298_c0_g1_i1.p1 TRINITY_DN13298_c0_g1~~TRINITY_DN13298_c0_g1_i1.p1  ORF type:complete len:152 (+),score=22.78 TRINITY_DN13298_c0_g1_i1:129-584(+)
MQIPLRCQCEASTCTEWALVELQGCLEVQNSVQLQNLSIGKLCRKGEDKFGFTVGYHELEGSRVALRKPLLVLRKATDTMDPGTDAEAGHSKMEIVGIIRHKVLFKSRPKALITKPEVRGKKARPSPAAADGSGNGQLGSELDSEIISGKV